MGSGTLCVFLGDNELIPGRNIPVLEDCAVDTWSGPARVLYCLCHLRREWLFLLPAREGIKLGGALRKKKIIGRPAVEEGREKMAEQRMRNEEEW